MLKPKSPHTFKTKPADAQSVIPKSNQIPSEIVVTYRLESPPKQPSVQAQIAEEPPL